MWNNISANVNELLERSDLDCLLTDTNINKKTMLFMVLKVTIRSENELKTT